MENISLNLDDLDDDLLEAENDFEIILSGQQLQIPEDQEPTLESILNEDDDLDNDEILKSLTQSLTILENEPKSRSTSFNSQYLIEKNGIVCKQTFLKQISTQLKTAIDRSDAGLPTALDVSSLIAIGTSRGLVLLFDSNQILKLYITTESNDAISALSLNNTSDRLLVGNSSGLILMYDTNGKLLRKISDAHPLGNAILNLKFTDDPKVAVFSDSGGSVFMLDFKRVMGVRSADTTCLFSGSRGEVCHIEPLKFDKFSQNLIEKLGAKTTVKKNIENLNQLFSKYSILAMASFTKIFIVSLKPKLTVLYTFPLNNSLKYLPILNWQFVILQSDESKRFITPILTCARESTIHYFQLDYFLEQTDENLSKKFKFLYSKKSDYNFKILNFTWLNAKTLAILDHLEKLHIFDIKSNEELQCININVKLVYNSSFFKSLATGGYVSKALAYAGENSCYQSIRNYLGQLFMLGTESVSLFSLQNWSSRIDDFLTENNLDQAIDLAVSMYRGQTKALIGLPSDLTLRKEKICEKIIDILHLYVNRSIKQDSPKSGSVDLLEKHYFKTSQKLVSVCIQIERQDILFNNLYDLISCDAIFQGYFFESLEDPLLSNKLNDIPPGLIKKFIKYYKTNPELLGNLEKCLLHFNISNIDFHDVIHTCKKYSLIDAYINLFNKALGDYITPFEDVLKLMKPLRFLKSESNKIEVSNQVAVYGNKLLVYLHCCLCGQGYPYGHIDDLELCDNVRRTTFDYLTSSSNKMIDELLKEEPMDLELINYPIMRIFLNFDIMDFLNVISMSFNEPSFEAVVGLDKKQHLIDILIEICLKKNQIDTSSYLNNRKAAHLFTFLARQIANINNNIQINNAIFTQMVEYLCNREETTRVEEREQTLLSLLNSLSIQILERFDLDRLLNLCKKAKFYRACEILYEFKSEYHEIIDCYLNDENSLERQCQIFNFIRNVQNILYEQQTESIRRKSTINRKNTIIEPRDVQLKKLYEKLYQPEIINRMLNLNPNETVHLLWIELNLDLKTLTQTIKNNPEILFKFLKSLLELVDLIKTDRKYINYLSQFGGEYCELYVDLICQFEPDNLVNILKTSLSEYSFRIDECIRICRERQNIDGLAYLLEKSGQIESAFSLHLEKMNSLIKELQKNLEILDDREVELLKHKIDALLIMIVKLCQTNSCALEDATKEKIWFSLFDEVMRPIQSLFIDPKIELFLDEDQKTVQRLNETKEFFKNLGSYIINSMVGYVNLTTIIDRMICNPLYGASNFGDIKHLMIKMLEMCSYEQTLLDKTDNLVSDDVYSKMCMYKKLSSRSFSALSNFCQSCSKPLDLDGENLDVSIFHCGHSFHLSCLDVSDLCPICNLRNQSVKSTKFKKKEKKYVPNIANDFLNEEIVIPGPGTSKSIEMNEANNEKSNDSHFLNLSEGQLNALKFIRTRNSSVFRVNKIHGEQNYGFNTTLERNSKLNLTPANLIKFI
ncbi:unnamed protein product [Brachionus calyciflorus]|uniref:RING-type domain-containing protein n=1 Tax=Brachionus calyciflorus TaxID=104777 RepID=A0A813UAV7_9BILA|nr:unnamed protein product [Brachionus calyciflorus]